MVEEALQEVHALYGGHNNNLRGPADSRSRLSSGQSPAEGSNAAPARKVSNLKNLVGGGSKDSLPSSAVLSEGRMSQRHPGIRLMTGEVAGSGEQLLSPLAAAAAAIEPGLERPASSRQTQTRDPVAVSDATLGSNIAQRHTSADQAPASIRKGQASKQLQQPTLRGRHLETAGVHQMQDSSQCAEADNPGSSMSDSSAGAPPLLVGEDEEFSVSTGKS